MIDSHNHPLDEIEACGVTAHGLVRFDSVLGYRRFVDDVPWPMAGTLPSNAWPLQMVRMPGIPEVPLTPERLAEEREQGRVWQNYALLLSEWRLFGQNIGGWIYFASDGVRWVIRPGILPQPRAGQPYSVTLDCRPFGYLDEAPAEPVELIAGIADIQQEGTAFRLIEFETINSTGSVALLRLFPVGGGLPTGYLRIDISDVDGELAAAMSVQLSEVAVRGEWSTTHPGISSAASLYQSRAMLPQANISGHDTTAEGFPIFPIGGGTVNATLAGLVEVDAARTVGFASYATYRKGSGEVVSGRTGRVIGLAFDHADVLCQFAYDTQYRYTFSMPSPAGSASGALTATASSAPGALVGVIGYPMGVITPVAAEVSRTISERIERTVRLTRNGVAVMEALSAKHYSAVHVIPLAPVAPGVDWCFSALYSAEEGVSDIRGFGTVGEGGGYTLPLLLNAAGVSVPTVATQELGGPWPREWVTTPSTTTGLAAPQYAGEVPVGTDQRDADTIGLNVSPVFYQAGRAGNGMSISEREVIEGVTQIREMCVAWPHATAEARGILSASSGAAYHPLTHDLVTDNIGGTPVSFI